MKLNKLYKLLPEVKCEQGCTLCCSPVYMLPSEAKKLGITDRTYTKWDESYDCEFLTPQGCSVYEIRPFVCRHFGCSDHGLLSCKKVIGEILSEEDAGKLLRMYMQILVDSKNEPPEKVIEAMHHHDQLMALRGNKIIRLLPEETEEGYMDGVMTKIKGFK